jgi:hypothetical protein
MTASSPLNSNNPVPVDLPDEATVQALLLSLRRKEGTWFDWGQACQTLQKANLTPQQIFEETGFEPIHQNQIIVATQVYASMQAVGVSEQIQQHFATRGSDTLYEFRILSQTERVAAAELVVQKGVDSEGSREVARAIKDFSRLSKPPEAFTAAAGDAVAHYYWKLAQQQSDLAMRSRLIAQALRFVVSDPARQTVEKLLMDFTTKPSRRAPLLPVYRLDSEEELPRIIPVAGKLPLSAEEFKAVPVIDEAATFGIVQFSGTGAWVAVPGWQVILNADDPVALVGRSDQVAPPLEGKPEEVLVVVDRSQRTWNNDHHFLVDSDNTLQLHWSDEEYNLPILGQVILVMRPKRILDESVTRDPWQIDE